MRTEARLTHEELANGADMSFQRISELERGVGNPTLPTLLRISKGLGVDLSDVILRMEKIAKSRPQRG